MLMDRSNATTGLAVLLAVVLLLVGYAIYRNGQTHKSTKSQNQTSQVGPKLQVGGPADNTTVSTSKVDVKGTTDKGDTVTVNDQPVTVDKNGNFATNVSLSDTDNFVFIKARSSSGKETVIERKVVYSPSGAVATTQTNTAPATAKQQTKQNNAAASAPLGTTGVGDPLAFLAVAAVGAGYYQLRKSRKQLTDTISR
jgi:uncharacterized protein HemX